MRRVYVVTGTSKGLGAALRELLKDETCVTVGRADADVTLDLSLRDLDVSPLSEALAPYDEIVLIGNAGSVEPVERLRNVDAARLESSAYLHYLNPAKIILDIVKSGKKFLICHVTTGAAFTGNPRMGAYASSKAAMHRFVEILGVEEEDNPRNMGVFAFDPGRMRTGMQEALGTPGAGKDPREVGRELLSLIRQKLP